MISDAVIGYIGIGAMLGLLFMGMPIYLATGIVGFWGLLWMQGFEAAVRLFGVVPYHQGSYYILITIPLFVLMGSFTFHSGIGEAMYNAAHKFIGHLPGGLAMSTVVACSGFAACSGSSIANAAAMGVVAIPEMLKYGYDRRLASGTVAAGGTLGIMIPPSTSFIIYGAITRQSIGKLFIAGVFPGLLLAAAFIAVIYVWVKTNPRLAPPAPALSWKERFSSVGDLWMPVCIFLLVIGGLYVGYFTPTEGGAVGAFGTLLFVILRKRLTTKVLVSSIAETVKVTGMIFLIFIGAHMFGNFLTLTRLPVQLADWVIALHVPPFGILVAIFVFYIVLGMFMDFLAGMIVTLPILFPIVEAVGFDMIWFGVLMTLLGELGLISPPVGMNIFVLRGLSGVSLEDIYRGVLPFCVIDLIILTILTVFPQISLFLPGTME